MRVLDVVRKVVRMHYDNVIIRKAAPLENLIRLCTANGLQYLMKLQLWLSFAAQGWFSHAQCRLGACARPDMQEESGLLYNISMQHRCPASRQQPTRSTQTHVPVVVPACAARNQ